MTSQVEMMYKLPYSTKWNVEAVDVSTLAPCDLVVVRNGCVDVVNVIDVYDVLRDGERPDDPYADTYQRTDMELCLNARETSYNGDCGVLRVVGPTDEVRRLTNEILDLATEQRGVIVGAR